MKQLSLPTGRSALWLVLGALLLTACQSQLNLMPTPEVLRDPRFNVFQTNRMTDNELTTFFVTSRKPSGGSHFGSGTDDELHFGAATARIGAEGANLTTLIQESTTAEREDQPVWTLPATSVLGSVEKPLGIPSELPASLVDFFKRLNEAVDATVTRALTIYVHGANSTFEWSVSQGAQYQYFTGDNEVVLTFSWPSPGSLLGYGRDKRHSNRAAADFADVLALLGRYSTARAINVIAFSSGGRVAGGALALLGERGIPAADLRLGQVYLTQSDEPLEKFLADLPHIYPLVGGLTITTDPDDPVLGLARLTDMQRRLGAPVRDSTAKDLGLTDAEADRLRTMVNSKRMTVIDLSSEQIQGFKFSHGAWYENPWVSTDTLVILLLGLPAEERGLDVYTTGLGLNIWYFPADYLDRLKTRLASTRKP